MSRLILIAGAPESGKNDIGNYLVERYGYTRLTFADLIIADLNSEYPDMELETLDMDIALDSEYVFIDKCDNNGIFVPNQAVTLRRKLYEHKNKRLSENSRYWVNKMIHKIISGGLPYKIVITDWHEPEQAILLKNNLDIKIHKIKVIKIDIEISESFVPCNLQIFADKKAVTIPNNESIMILRHRVAAFMASIAAKDRARSEWAEPFGVCGVSPAEQQIEPYSD